jgi:hypothetical protein
MQAGQSAPTGCPVPAAWPTLRLSAAAGDSRPRSRSSPPGVGARLKILVVALLVSCACATPLSAPFGLRPCAQLARPAARGRRNGRSTPLHACCQPLTRWEQRCPAPEHSPAWIAGAMRRSGGAPRGSASNAVLARAPSQHLIARPGGAPCRPAPDPSAGSTARGAAWRAWAAFVGCQRRRMHASPSEGGGRPLGFLGALPSGPLPPQLPPSEGDMPDPERRAGAIPYLCSRLQRSQPPPPTPLETRAPPQKRTAQRSARTPALPAARRRSC